MPSTVNAALVKTAAVINETAVTLRPIGLSSPQA
jgi:hypothetical protein